MVNPIFSGQQIVMAERLLDATALRHEALASNIANAETPGYKRIDLSTDFQTQLNAAVQENDPTALQTLTPTVTEDPNAVAVRPDGNNVAIDKEMMEVSRNSEQYQFLAQYLTTNLQSIRMAISSNPQ